MYWLSIWMNYFSEWRNKLALENDYLYAYRTYAYRLAMGDIDTCEYHSGVASLREKYRALGLSLETMRRIERFPIRIE